jgi:hypothetical protein
VRRAALADGSPAIYDDFALTSVAFRSLGLPIATLLVTACATVPLPPAPVDPAGVAAPGFVFARDSFAFPNDIRARNPDKPDLYANYCFVLARGLRQFHESVRFAPVLPRLDHAGYVERVRRAAARPPWRPPLPPDDRVVIPGYASLREFSAAQEAAVKEGLGGRFWTWIHWTNWRVVLPVTGGHQESVAGEIMEELRGGRLVQLLVTNLPRIELNHTLVAYAFRDSPTAVEFSVWDPNDPTEPGLVVFDRQSRGFVAARVHDTEPGPIRVFRMYYSRLL